jgi:hypothetical protein
MVQITTSLKSTKYEIEVWPNKNKGFRADLYDEIKRLYF